MKLLANSSCGYHVLDRSRHTAKKYLRDEKLHEATGSKLFKKRDLVNNSFYEVELAKAHIEHKESISVGFFIPKYAKFLMLELYYLFLNELCDVIKFKELEKDTDLLFLALVQKVLEMCI